MPSETSGARLLARRYRLVAHVGRGGMGTVWQAHDEVLGRDVAVKEVILPHGLTDDERAVQYKRTFREARTAARLGHPGVVTVYDVVEEDGRPWIVMELIKARSLDQVIKDEGPMEPRRAADIGRQMLAALHAAHDAGVLHRDVKPSNVLVTSTGRAGDRAVLTDFGIATASGDATLTQTGLVMGSPAYIAPERARGRTAGPASDLWSLGVTLYAMVHGRSPFERSEPMAALVAVISEEPEPPHRAGRLTPVIEGLLRKDPDARMDAIEAGALLDDIVRRETIDDQRTLAVDFRESQPPAEAARTRVTPVAETPEDPVPAASWTPDSWDAGPGTQAAGAAATGPAGQGGRARPALNRNALVVIGAVLALIVVVAGIALAASGDDDKKGERKGAATPTQKKQTPTRKASDPPTSATPTANGSTLPAGFRMYEDPSGYSVPVPKGWSGPERKQGGDFFYAPDRQTYIQIGQTKDPGPSAIGDWRNQERGGSGFRAYEKIKIAPTGDEPPVPDTGNGDKSADWEFTFDGGGTRMHILNRGFVANGYGYAILVRAPDARWKTVIAELQPVYRFFEPAGE
ncbi:serine/threonine-protein kinase [Spirillospora albida]|uniref:serine/threonine-protein kinase n=1 Tax=Spirillospora albida TaxID=58123 RepID=UPI000565EECC|nr:serine/threonine-protein kinase [Spirillospora albida]